MSNESSKDVIKQWWSERPMTYGLTHGDTTYAASTPGADGPLALGTKEFFENLDKTFYRWNEPLHTEAGFFGRIFAYERYRQKRVLEIGCGLGTMAMNWALHGACVTAVDLNPLAAAQTARRFKLFGLPGRFAQIDANNVGLKTASFDYAYSWGVFHHSPDLERSIKEMFRVLRPDGEFGVMLYNRNSLRYRYIISYLEGFVHGESRFLSRLELASRYTDAIEGEGNPHTWPVTRREMRRLFGPLCERLQMETFGEELESTLDFLLPVIGKRMPRALRNVWARRLGWSLWISGAKRRG